MRQFKKKLFFRYLERIISLHDLFRDLRQSLAQLFDAVSFTEDPLHRLSIKIAQQGFSIHFKEGVSPPVLQKLSIVFLVNSMLCKCTDFAQI